MAGPHTTHVVFYTEGETLDVIADCACSRTLAGSRWIKDYIYVMKEHDIPYFVIDQDEVFKFGGPRLYPSKKALVGWLRIGQKWVAIKVSIVAVNVPLLLSRPALAALGTNYRMEDNMADFTNLGLNNVQLKFTSTGHPKVDAVSFDGSPAPSWPERVDWSVTELHIPVGSETADTLGAYMADRLVGGVPKLFYPKVSPSAEEFLCRDPFPHELFLNWWKQNEITKDFWIETSDCMIRIHVTPRRTPFDPRRWQTSNDILKKQLMGRLGEVRTSTFVPCYNHTMPIEVQHEWQCDPGQRPEFLWIGRSRFCRNSTKQAVALPDRGTADASQVCHAVAMADEPGHSDSDLGGEGHHLQAGVDCPRAPCHAPGGEADDGGRQQEHGRHHQDEYRRAEGEVPPGGDSSAGQVQPGQFDETSEGESVTDGGGACLLRVLQGLQVQRGARGLPAMGDGGDGQQPEPFPRLGSPGQVGGTPPSRNIWSRIWEWRPGGQCRDRTPQDASQAEATSGTSVYQQELSDVTDTGDSERGGQQRLLPGGSDDGGADLGPRDSSGSLEVYQEGRGRACREEEDGASVETRSKTQVKKREYWDKVNELIAMRRAMRERSHIMEDEHALDTNDTAVDAEAFYTNEAPVDDDTVDTFNIDEYDTDENTGFPTVRLHYPSDYDTVKNLPSKRLKRSSKKKVRSWARKALQCLVTMMVAYSAPVASLAEEVIIEPMKDLAHAVMGPAGPASDQADLLELFAGSAHLTEEFVRQGYSVAEPRDIVYGHDLFDHLQQREIFQAIDRSRPKLLWVALPCTKWSPWQRLNYAQRRQQLRRERQKQRKLVHFAVECAWQQIAAGNEVIFEHPKYSDLWTDPSMESLVDSTFMAFSNVDMCRYNLRAVTDGGRLRKPTKIMASNPALLDQLRRTCPGGHEHTPTEGQNTKPAGVYTKEFCKAVVAGYVKFRKNLWNFAGENYEGNTWAAYAVQDAQDEAEGEQGDGGAVTKGNITGITLPGHVPATLAKALRRIHQNLGHPSNADLARHLKLAGASEEAVKASQSIHCETCASQSNPGTRRPAKIVRPLEFNQEVSVDTINLQDNRGKKVEVLSILDQATGYHVVKRISGRNSAAYASDFNTAWSMWAGPPLKVTCDQERGFMKEFADYLEMGGTQVRYTAGQAHWQHGAIERQNFWYRTIWDKVVMHTQPDEKEIDYVLSIVASAKNNLRRRHGYSPAQWLFGSSPRLGDALADESERLYQLEDLRSADDVWRRKQSIRQAAREAFIQTQADDALKRAVLGRPRTSNQFEVGDYVYIYRVDKTASGKARVRQNIGEWIGPGLIVGKEGASYWVSRGGRCLLCAAEHLRPAESEELGGAFQTKALKEDLLKLINNLEDLEDDETFADATDPVITHKRALPPGTMYAPGRSSTRETPEYERHGEDEETCLLTIW